MARAPNANVIAQPSQRVFTQWTPALIRSAFLQAESGNVRLMAELCDNMLADDRIGTVFETRIGGLLGLPLDFEASGDGRRRNKAVKALEADEDWWAAFPESELQPFLTWGRLAGFSFGQLHPTEHEGRYVPRLEFWHPRNTRYDWIQRRWFAKTGTGTDVPIEIGNGQWIAYMPYGAYRPWAHGIWRGLSRWWLLKSYAQDDSGRRSEKSGTAAVESQVQNSAAGPGDKALRDEIAADFNDALHGGVIVFPPGFKASMLSSAESIKDNQAIIVDQANIAAAVAVLGQNLTTEVKQGSFAAAQVHNKVEIQRIRSDGETASTCLHDQALEWWAEFNYGDRSLAPWPIWRTDPPTDQKARADALNTLSLALVNFAKLGYELDAEDLESDFGVRLVKREPIADASAAQQTPLDESATATGDVQADAATLPDEQIPPQLN